MVDVSQFAILKNIGNISDTALIKKFIQCKDWILWMISKMIPNEIIHYKKPAELGPYHVIAVDASNIVQKGAINYQPFSASRKEGFFHHVDYIN